MVTETTTLDVDRDHDLGLGIVLVSGVGQTDLLLTLGDGGIGQQTGLSARNRHPILTGAAQRSARCRGVVLHRQRGIRRLHGLYNRPDDCVLRSGRVERAALAVDQRDGNAGVQLNAGGQFGLLLDGILLGRTRNADLILPVSVGSECSMGIGSGDSQLLGTAFKSVHGSPCSILGKDFTRTLALVLPRLPLYFCPFQGILSGSVFTSGFHKKASILCHFIFTKSRKICVYFFTLSITQKISRPLYFSAKTGYNTPI